MNGMSGPGWTASPGVRPIMVAPGVMIEHVSYAEPLHPVEVRVGHWISREDADLDIEGDVVFYEVTGFEEGPQDVDQCTFRHRAETDAGEATFTVPFDRQVLVIDDGPRCQRCGCHEFRSGCYWAADDLCSACLPKLSTDQLVALVQAGEFSHWVMDEVIRRLQAAGS